MKLLLLVFIISALIFLPYLSGSGPVTGEPDAGASPS